MKKLLVLSAVALFAGMQLNADRVVVEEKSTGAIRTGHGECGRVQGPFYKGRCAEEHKIVCPACPDIQCPACPICPEVTCEAKVVETCPTQGCAVQVKTCDICSKPWKSCGGCQHRRHGHRHVEQVTVVQQAPAAAAPAAVEVKSNGSRMNNGKYSRTR